MLVKGGTIYMIDLGLVWFYVIYGESSVKKKNQHMYMYMISWKMDWRGHMPYFCEKSCGHAKDTCKKDKMVESIWEDLEHFGSSEWNLKRKEAFVGYSGIDINFFQGEILAHNWKKSRFVLQFEKAMPSVCCSLYFCIQPKKILCPPI